MKIGPVQETLQAPEVTRVRRQKRTTYPFDQVPVGGGFTVSCDKRSRAKVVNRVRSAAYNYCKSREGVKFSIVATDDGAVITRQA